MSDGWFLRGQLWTYEHILESQYWKDLPERIDKTQLEEALSNAHDADMRVYKEHGYWWAREPKNPTAKDVFCDRANEEIE